MKLPTREEAFASQNYDPNKVEITGVPTRHVKALKALANLFIIHDSVNSEFNPDFENLNHKYSNRFKPGSPSGAGFCFHGYDGWNALSFVGARLVSENHEKAEHVAKIAEQDYKNFMVYDRGPEMFPQITWPYIIHEGTLKEIKLSFAEYKRAEGCGCCRNNRASDEAENKLGKLLNAKLFPDESGFDWDAPQEISEKAHEEVQKKV